jgi:hypothetical protein
VPGGEIEDLSPNPHRTRKRCRPRRGLMPSRAKNTRLKPGATASRRATHVASRRGCVLPRENRRPVPTRRYAAACSPRKSKTCPYETYQTLRVPTRRYVRDPNETYETWRQNRSAYAARNRRPVPAAPRTVSPPHRTLRLRRAKAPRSPTEPKSPPAPEFRTGCAPACVARSRKIGVGRDPTASPSLRTGQADLPHLALQLVILFRAVGRA